MTPYFSNSGFDDPERDALEQRLIDAALDLFAYMGASAVLMPIEGTDMFVTAGKRHELRQLLNYD